jgi:hypothetical protein
VPSDSRSPETATGPFGVSDVRGVGAAHVERAAGDGAGVTRVDDHQHFAAAELAEQLFHLVVGDEAGKARVRAFQLARDVVGRENLVEAVVAFVAALVLNLRAMPGEIEDHPIAGLRAVDQPGLELRENGLAGRGGVSEEMDFIGGDIEVLYQRRLHVVGVGNRAAQVAQAADAAEQDLRVVIDADDQRAVLGERGGRHPDAGDSDEGHKRSCEHTHSTIPVG